MTKADEELLPCPFKHAVEQGSRAVDYEPYADDSLSEDSNWCIYCPVCRATSGFYNTEEEARKAWNTRTRLSDSEARAKALEIVKWFNRECQSLHKEPGNALVDRITELLRQ